MVRSPKRPTCSICFKAKRWRGWVRGGRPLELGGVSFSQSARGRRSFGCIQAKAACAVGPGGCRCCHRYKRSQAFASYTHLCVPMAAIIGNAEQQQMNIKEVDPHAMLYSPS